MSKGVSQNKSHAQGWSLYCERGQPELPQDPQGELVSITRLWEHLRWHPRPCIPTPGNLDISLSLDYIAVSLQTSTYWHGLCTQSWAQYPGGYKKIKKPLFIVTVCQEVYINYLIYFSNNPKKWIIRSLFFLKFNFIKKIFTEIKWT